MSQSDHLVRDEIAARLSGRAARLSLECLTECDSTNERALARLREGTAGATQFVIAAETQTAGRGRRGARWITPAGDAIAFTFGWRYPGSVDELAGLSLAVGVAVVRGLAALEITAVRLKWPNDLLVGDAKLGGVLVETVAPRASAAGRRADTGVAVGIGLNVRLPAGLADTLARPLASIQCAMAPGAAVPSRNVIIAALAMALTDALERFEQSRFATFRDAWTQLHAWQDRRIVVRAGASAPVAGVLRGVDSQGALLLATASGLRTIHSGDIALAP